MAAAGRLRKLRILWDVGRYYYLPRDFRYDTEASIARSGIGQDKWQAWFAKIKARKSILIYDTCENGTLTLGTPDQVAMRGGCLVGHLLAYV